MVTRPQLVRIGYTTLNFYIALAGLLLVLETSRFRSTWSDRGAPLLITSLFLIVPLSAAILWLLNRRCRSEHTKWQKAYLIVSRVILSCAWLISLMPVLFWVAETKPATWPFTFMEGPDTKYSRKAFTRALGYSPPSSVSKVYYRSESSGMDSRSILHFVCRDTAVIREIISREALQESSEPKTGWNAGQVDPWWWLEKNRRVNLKCFFSPFRDCYLWYDFETGTVWYETFTT